MASTQYTVSRQGNKLIVTVATLTAITTVAMGLRIYVRAWVLKSFRIDDWFSVLGWVAFVAFASATIASAYHGFGQHADLIQPPSEIVVGFMLTWISQCLYATSSMIIKLSICLMLLRFVTERLHNRCLYLVICITSVVSVVFLFIFIFQCMPVSFFWQRTQGDAHGKCVSTKFIIIGTYINSVFLIVWDCSMAIWPWFLVRGLRMDTRTKILVVFVLAMGSVASVASIGRLVCAKNLSSSSDILYEFTDIAIWSFYETGLGLFASCVATLRPLLRMVDLPRQNGNLQPEHIISPNTSISLRKMKRPRLSYSGLLNSHGTEYTLGSLEHLRTSTEQIANGSENRLDNASGDMH